jgi:predicted amidohydrolase
MDKTGIIGAARKFYPTGEERDWIAFAPSHVAQESGLPRTFTVGGSTFYVAVCYDTFGIHHQELENPGVDGVLVLAHQFNRRGDGGSGDVDFARKGLAGAARQWECPVFGAAVFNNRPVPDRWPSGIIWNQGDTSVKNWKYTDNPLVPEVVQLSQPELDGVVVRLFRMGSK